MIDRKGFTLRTTRPIRRPWRAARGLLADDGFIVVRSSHPIRCAVERAEQRQTSLGEECFSPTSTPTAAAGATKIILQPLPDVGSGY